MYATTYFKAEVTPDWNQLLNLHGWGELCVNSCSVQVSSDDTDNYKKGLKAQLKQVLDADKDLLGGAPEFVIACLQPFGSEATAKAAKKVSIYL